MRQTVTNDGTVQGHQMKHPLYHVPECVDGEKVEAAVTAREFPQESHLLTHPTRNRATFEDDVGAALELGQE